MKMFRRREPNMMDMNPYQQNGFYPENQIQRIFYQFEETNRKLRNLNNRLRRIENFLGLKMEDKYDEDLYYNE